LTLLELKLSSSFNRARNGLRVTQPSEPLSLLKLTLTLGMAQKVYFESNTML
jgi:hypothetical protein